MSTHSAWRKVGLGFIAIWFLLGGIGHFVVTDAFVSVTLAFVPFPRAVVLATGAFEILAALALYRQQWRRAVGLALIGFVIAVTPVHVEMLRHTDRYPEVGELALWARLAFQPMLAALIWRVTQSAPKPA